ncbi:MAG: hypothetical protein ACPGYY_08730 [Bacteroidia bacterium]
MPKAHKPVLFRSPRAFMELFPTELHYQILQVSSSKEALFPSTYFYLETYVILPIYQP